MTHRLRWALRPKWSQRVYNRTQPLTALRPACPRTLILGGATMATNLEDLPALRCSSHLLHLWIGRSLNSQSRWAVPSPPRTILSPFLLGMPPRDGGRALPHRRQCPEKAQNPKPGEPLGGSSAVFLSGEEYEEGNKDGKTPCTNKDHFQPQGHGRPGSRSVSFLSWPFPGTFQQSPFQLHLV